MSAGLRKQLMFATGNPGKLEEVRRIALRHNIEILSPQDIDIHQLDVDESGATFEENAIKKFSAYASAMKVEGLPLVADDSGLAIDYLGGEPGVKSRRWKDGETEMSDQEMIDYCLEMLDGVPSDKRTVHFDSVMAYGLPGSKPKLAKSKLTGIVLEKPNMSCYTKGYPFRALFYVPKYSMMLHDLVSLPPDKRPKGFISHREDTITKVINDLFGLKN